MKNTITLKDFKELANSDIVVFMQTNNKDWDVYATHNHETYKLIDRQTSKNMTIIKLTILKLDMKLKALKRDITARTPILFMYISKINLH